MNKLYFGDNLDILKNNIRSESVDLIYLDPPFNSGKDYNILFKPEKEQVKGATAQIQTFQDTWHWGEQAEREYQGIIDGSINLEAPNQAIINLIQSFRSYLGESSIMAYLTMMAPRLIEMHRVLKQTGSIYLHCDSTASHYLKLLMDAIFGVINYKNEIVWKRTYAHNEQDRYGRISDRLLFYTKSGSYLFNYVFTSYDQSYIDNFFKYSDDIKRYRLVILTGPGITSGESGSEWKGYNPTKIGRHWATPSRLLVKFLDMNTISTMTISEKLDFLYEKGLIVISKNGVPSYKQYLDEMPGVPLQDIWSDINPISHQSAERLGYPTQKPEALLERIIKASSNEGDIVLDPFCGCGTTVAVSQRLNRQWIGIDITYLSIDIIKKRFEKNGIKEKEHFIIDGAIPTVYEDAEKLALLDPFQFQFWAISKIPGAMPNSTKTGDKGIDGFINFVDPNKQTKAGKGLISVKGTKTVNPVMIRELIGTVQKHNADFGILLTLIPPTAGMKKDAISEGFFQFMGEKKIPKIQILSVEDLFKSPLPVILPHTVYNAFKTPAIKEENPGLF